MRRMGNRLATPLFALLLAASLAFGVTSAFAQADRVAAAPVCPNNNDDLLGNCSATCNQRCLDRHYVSGTCISDQTGTAASV